MRDSPVSTLGVVVRDALDNAWSPLLPRLAAIDERQYRWEPAPGCWTIRHGADGWRADWADPDPDPAPLTTIAWRAWHIAVDCLDSYSGRLFGRTGTGLTGTAWVGTHTEATALLDAAWRVFRDGVDTWSEADLLAPLGERWGDFARHTNADLALHAAREVIHHGAEITLLLDLHRSTAPTSSAADPDVAGSQP